MLEIKINQQQFQDVQDRLAYIKNGANLALSRALNKTAAKAKTEASKAIRSQVRLSASYVKEKINGPADGFEYKATTKKLTAKLSTPKRGVRLDNFLVSPKPNMAGKPYIGEEPRVQVKPNGRELTIWSGFWVPAKNSGGYLIAVRNEVLRQQGMKIKLAPAGYTVLSGPSISQVFNTVRDDISISLSEYLATVMERETAWLITKNPPPAGDGSDGN